MSMQAWSPDPGGTSLKVNFQTLIGGSDAHASMVPDPGRTSLKVNFQTLIGGSDVHASMVA